MLTSKKTLILASVAIAVIVVIAVVIYLAPAAPPAVSGDEERGNASATHPAAESRNEQPADESHGEQPTDDGIAHEAGHEERVKIDTGERPGGGHRRFAEDSPMEDFIIKNARWNPPRPLRFVVTWGEARAENEARRRAESVRQRFLDGESAFTLIRELSDPPRGVPPEELRRYENLPPDQASPVLVIDGGFAVLFGTPSSPE